MQNKGLFKLFAFLFGIISIYQLSFSFRASQIEGKAETFAENKIAKTQEDYLSKRDSVAQRYLDSIENIKSYDLLFTEYTYAEVKAKELNKGLDLKGGINVILQISVKDILKGLANNSKHPVFTQALENADQTAKDSDDTYIELFFEAFDAIKGDTQLASPDIFANKSLSDEINFQMSDDQVRPILRRKIDESVVSAFEVLRKRIDKFGVTQPNIQRLGNSGRILVELPGAKDVDRIKKLLQSTAQLEFWETFKSQDVLSSFIFPANQKLASILETEERLKEEVLEKIDTLKTDSANSADEDINELLANVEEEENEGEDTTDRAKKNPLLDLVKTTGGAGSPVIAMVATKDTATFSSYLNRPEIQQLRPAALQFARFAWGKMSDDKEEVELYALQANREGTPAMSGGVIVDARDTFDQAGRPAVSMQMNGKGAKEWEALTGNAYETQGNIAIVLDNIVYSAPGVSSGPISGGSSEITGQFSIAETKDLANVLRAGKLPASADIIQSAVVGPSLGQEAINNGLTSFVIAMIFVLIWMIFYYGRAGIFADIALVLNILLIFGVLASLDAVLTLPGIAGIVLTIGMSVDANVLIFERIKEELVRGKGLREGIADGFSNALSSILDANVTTGLTALILLLFGTGPIKGFATTLLIGILTSLFTAIFITRLLVEWYIGKKKPLAFATSITKNLFKNLNIRFLKKRKMAYIISGTLILIGVVSLFTQGLDQGVDFVGGRSYQIRFEQPVNPSQLGTELSAVLGSAQVKTFGGTNQVKVTTKYKVDVEGTEVDKEIQEKLFTVLGKYLPDGMTYEGFVSGSNEAKLGILQAIKVGPTIADDIKTSAGWAIFGSLIVVFLYILLRFRRWQFSLGAVAAVFHDVMIVLGIFSLTHAIMPFSMEIDQAFIAAILTVIGYSLNDTVVVFDRIREIVGGRGWRGGENIDLALNSTLSRTINTSLTTLVVLLSIFIFGGETLRGFMFAMIVGIIVGTYSSVFIATPVMFDSLKNTIADESKDDQNASPKTAPSKKQKAI